MSMLTSSPPKQQLAMKVLLLIEAPAVYALDMLATVGREKKSAAKQA